MLLRRLKQGGHRCLIFTQMSRMLDVLEIFLNLHAYTYLRLDGSTKPESRQIMMQVGCQREFSRWEFSSTFCMSISHFLLGV